VHRGSQRLRQVDAAQDGEWPAPSSAGADPFQGTPLVGKTPREILKMGIVQVPQQHSLFKEMTVEENVSLGPSWSEIVVRCRAASNRCARSSNRDRPSEDKAGSLSGGQQRSSSSLVV